MYVRLAFAVAAHLEPEILLVDEVLAVGDAQFQQKCLGKMGDVPRQAGPCSSSVTTWRPCRACAPGPSGWEDGELREEGAPGVVVSRYLQDAAATLPHQLWPDAATAPGNDRVRLRAARAAVDGLDAREPITTRTPVRLEFEYWNLREGAQLSLTLHLANEDGVLVFSAGPVGGQQWQDRPLPHGLFRDTCLIPGNLLNDGLHRAELLVVDRDTELVHRERDILVFEVRDSPDLRGRWFGEWKGAVRPVLDWTTERIEDPVTPSSRTS